MALVSPALVARRIRLAMPRIDERVLVLCAAAVCIPLSFIVYWPSLDDFFVFDDYLNLATVRIHSFPAGMVRAFNFTVPRPMDPAIPSWRPLIDIYFYAAKPVGLHSQPYHMVNFALHGFAGGLAVLLLARLQRSVLVAAATGLLFVVAPTYDYAVSWIGQVSELLGLVLILAALNSYYSYLTGEAHRPLLAIATFAFTFFALLTKESTVVLAVLLPALVFTIAPDVRRSRPELGWSLAPPLAMILVFVLVMQIANAILEQTPDHFLGVHVAHNWWRFVEWMVLPHWPGEFMVIREALAALFVLCGVVSIILRQRLLSYFFLWTVVSIVPFAMFDHAIEFRYTYQATLPFIAFTVVGVDTLLRWLPRAALAPGYALLGTALVLALVVTPMRTRDAQAGFAFQSHHYELMVDSVRNACGPLSPDAHVFVVGSPIIDYFGHNVATALNLYYERVHAAAVAELSPLAAFVENKCVIQYNAATDSYTRVG